MIMLFSISFLKFCILKFKIFLLNLTINLN